MNSLSPGTDPTQDALVSYVESESGVALREYLTLYEESESPRTFLMWSLIAAAAGLVGKNAHLQLGELRVFPNLYVILIGPSGVRKSSAISMMTKLLESTTIYFGPTDTGGQRHGLMSALVGLKRSVFEGRKRITGDFAMSRAMMHPRDSSDMFLAISELGRLFGQGSEDMMNFFNDLYDGESIDYQTKIGETRVSSPRVTILGGTTPSNLATVLTSNSAEHGITARMLFVYADRKYKSVPIPPDQLPEWHEARDSFLARLRWIDQNRRNFVLLDSARAKYNDLYSYIPEVDDPRLLAYKERRGNTLIKVAITLAALRMATGIEDTDVGLAHYLLTDIELNMHKAFEYFGRNKKHAGRMLMVNYLKAHQKAQQHELIAAAASELTPKEALDALEAMVVSGEVVLLGSTYIPGAVRNKIKRI